MVNLSIVKSVFALFFIIAGIFLLNDVNATTVNGDLVIDDNDQTTLSSLTYVNGNVTVKDNGILTIDSTILQINQTRPFNCKPHHIKGQNYTANFDHDFI